MTQAVTRPRQVDQKPLRIPGDRLQKVLDNLVERKRFQHATLAAEATDGSVSWNGTAGTAYADGTPMSPDIPYFIASIDKLYTATAILKLCEQGRLSLDAPLSAVLPPELTDRIHVKGGVDYSDRITVGHLLSHTSGLADYLEDRPRGGKSLIARLIEGGEDRQLNVVTAMSTVREDLAPHFPPQDPESERSKVRYSDTNYLLLIAIIEALYKRALHEVVTELIFAPVCMRQTYFLDVSEPLVPTREPATLWSGTRALDLPQIFVSLRSVYSTLGDLALSAARNLGLIERNTTPTEPLVTLERTFRSHAVCSRYWFADFEGALIRLGKGWCRRERHATCPMREYCPYFQSWSNVDNQMR